MTSLKNLTEKQLYKKPEAALIGLPDPLKDKYDRHQHDLEGLADLAGLQAERYETAGDFRMMYHDQPLQALVTVEGYGYDMLKDWSREKQLSEGYTVTDMIEVPFHDGKYLTLKGLEHYLEEEHKPTPLFQGLQLIRELKSENTPIRNYAVFGGSKRQAEMICADHIDDRDGPRNLYEYLRAKNDTFFE